MRAAQDLPLHRAQALTTQIFAILTVVASVVSPTHDPARGFEFVPRFPQNTPERGRGWGYFAPGHRSKQPHASISYHVFHKNVSEGGGGGGYQIAIKPPMPGVQCLTR